MGKVRVKTFDESGELQDDKKRAKYEAKKAAKRAEATSAPESDSVVIEPADTQETSVEQTTPQKKVVKKKFESVKQADSKRHKANASLVDKSKSYSVKDAVENLKKFKSAGFDETVELHLNVTEKGINGQLTLPHGTGKKLRIKIADDEVIEEISGGKINFDVLVAKPDQMPKLAKVARILGPRGLMPNPKNGTISPNPDEAVAKLSAGQISYKTEAKDPIIHVSVGKVSFDNNKLVENITTLVQSVGASKIKSATLKSTMSPGIKVICS